MRPFRAMTTRGRAFLASGVTAVVCAVVLGLPELVKVGLLLVLLPALAALVATRGRHRLALTRAIEPSTVSAGTSAKVTLALSNESRSPTGLLLLEEQIPYTLGTRPRFVLDRMGPRWHRQLTYTVRSDVRGRYALGPLVVRVSDAFGLVELDRTFTSRAALVVTPRVMPLPAIPLAGSWTGSGDNRPRDFAGGSAEDVTVREYRRGDDLRRVHWRSSAHAGELMVRREEQPWQSRATLFLDNRRQAHRGPGPASSCEHAVMLAASVALHLTQRGFRVRLVTADGAEERSWHEHGAVSSESAPLLESLAVVAPSDRLHADTTWLGDGHPTGLLVAVLGDVSAGDRPLLSRMQHAARSPLALALDVERWARTRTDPSGADVATAALLSAQGWRAVGVDPTEAPARSWERLGLLATSGRGRRATGVTPS